MIIFHKMYVVAVVNAVSKESMFSPIHTNCSKMCGIECKGALAAVSKKIEVYDQSSRNEN